MMCGSSRADEDGDGEKKTTVRIFQTQPFRQKKKKGNQKYE